MGRPTDYTPELADAICEELAKGRPLAQICEDEGMPSYTTVWRWEQKHPEFRKASAHAREHGTHYMADDCIRIADDDEIEPADKRVRIDTRLRLIGKWNAKAYGDKVAHQHTGAGGGPIEYANLTPEQRRARIKELQERQQRGPDGSGGD